jgi:hypothetical protein
MGEDIKISVVEMRLENWSGVRGKRALRRNLTLGEWEDLTPREEKIRNSL